MDQIIALEYLGKSMSEEELNSFENTFSQLNIKFISRNKEGEIAASLDDLQNAMSLMIHSTLLHSIVQSMGPNAAWDAIKLLAIQCWKNTRGKQFFKVSSNKIEEKNFSLGIKVVSKEKGYDFKLDGITTEEEMNTSLDKILDFIREENEKDREYENEKYIARFSLEEEKWHAKDMDTCIREVYEKSKKAK